MGTLTTKFKLPSSVPNTSSNSKEIYPVRVKDVILDESHPEYTKYDSVDSIGAIKYSFIDRKVDTSDTKTLPVAFPISNHVKTLPLVNEIVLLVKGPKKDFSFEKVDYYIPTLALFNDINYLPSTDTNDNSVEGPGSEFQDSNTLRPLHPFNGDTIIQGRNGQSLRMSGAKSPKNTLTDDSNLNRPFTILSNGHVEIEQEKLYLEDINKDSSSIYLCSDHVIPLEQSRRKYSSLNEKPILSNSFKGSQILLNSGRIFCNSTTDDIQFSSSTLFGITAENVSIDAVSNIGLDAKKIYLGEKAKEEILEPIILGTQLELFLQTLLTTLENTGVAMKNARTIDQKVIPSINMQGAVLESISTSLLNRINLLQSKKVFTE